MDPAAESQPCPLCGTRESAPLLVAFDRQFPRDGSYDYVRCGACGLIYMSPLPAADEIPGFYPTDYGPHADRPKSILDKRLNRWAVRYHYGTGSERRSGLGRAIFRRLSPWILAGTHLPRGANRLLDIGCGSGGVLAKYAELGWSVKGIELSPGATETARGRGFEVHCGTVHDRPFAGETFDIVTMNHVIEHVLDPLEQLRAAAEYLAPDGRLWVLTPNAGGRGFEEFGTCWSQLDAPRHLMLFDVDTAKSLGERAGLRVASVRTPSIARILAESQHLADVQGERLPDDPAERRAVLEQPRLSRDAMRTARKAYSSRALKDAAVLRGEVIEIEYAAGADT